MDEYREFPVGLFLSCCLDHKAHALSEERAAKVAPC